MSRKKTIKLKPAIDPNADPFTGRISLAKTRAIWDTKDRTYTDDELLKIREWMYVIAEVIIHTVRKKKSETKIITLNEHNHEATQSHSLHPGEYRRAS